MTHNNKRQLWNIGILALLSLIPLASFAADAESYGATAAYRLASKFVMLQSIEDADKIALENGFKSGTRSHPEDMIVIRYAHKTSTIFRPRLPFMKLIFSKYRRLTGVMIAFDEHTSESMRKARSELSSLLGQPTKDFVDSAGNWNGPNYGVNFETGAAAQWNDIALSFGDWGERSVMFIERHRQ